MNDKHSCIPLIEEHANLFGKEILETAALDKGYWSAKNRAALLRIGANPVGLQRPSNIKLKDGDLVLQEHLQNRRAGIEPLIGHAKLTEGHPEAIENGPKELLKLPECYKEYPATLAAGYGSILGFNLRQMIRYQQGKITLTT